jgi:hypothetical protein
MCHLCDNRFNIPATADPESEANPWNILRKVATPQDYVVVKLDIDNTPVEEQFIAQLQASSDLSSLIDEFYFEHHVNVSVEPVESARCVCVLLRKSVDRAARCCHHQEQQRMLSTLHT